MATPPALIHQAFANTTAIKAISPNVRVDGMAVKDASTQKSWTFDADSVASAGATVLVPDAGLGRWLSDEELTIAATNSLDTRVSTAESTATAEASTRASADTSLTTRVSTEESTRASLTTSLTTRVSSSVASIDVRLSTLYSYASL